MLYVFLILGAIIVPIIKMSVKAIYYAKIGYNQIENENESAGVTGLTIGITIILISLFYIIF